MPYGHPIARRVKKSEEFLFLRRFKLSAIMADISDAGTRECLIPTSMTLSYGVRVGWDLWSSTVEFRILGALDAHHDGKEVKIGGPRQQIALAMMLLAPGKVIPVIRFIDAIWDGEPPATARAQVQICISNLRRRIAAVGDQDLIDTYCNGYLIRLDGSTLDLHEFEAAAGAGRRALAAGNAADAVAQFRAALSLWRGPAVLNISSALVENSVTHINELRLSVIESCLQAELLAGQFEHTVAELARLTSEYPLRERFRALQMTALFRLGRQAEALEVYRSTRSTLTSELGIEPGKELQDLHQMILSGDALPDSPGLAMPAVLPPQRPRPHLLPADIPDFAGRDVIVKALTTAASGGQQYAVPVNVLFGQGGVGKTTLAVHVAHRLADQFPDGQLFARLRVGERPVGPREVLGRFLHALGVDGSSLPDGVEERAEMYRDLLSGQRILVMLDDAVSQQQVYPLLPGSPTCLVVVTSRRRLMCLPADNRYELGAFSRNEAIQMFSRVVGPEPGRGRAGGRRRPLPAMR